MARKKAGTKILDDNGTLVTAAAGLRGAEAHSADEGEGSAKADKRDRAEPKRR